jgi:molybdopterin molybdotransferase
VTALEGCRDRQEIVTWLAERAGEGTPTLVGLDFPFAYATPFLDALGVPDFGAMLAHMAQAARPDRVASHIARCGQWWAEHDAHRDRRTHRLVERQASTRGAESPLRALPDGPGGFRFVGPRQVGLAALTGIAAIAAVKARAPAARVWPFEDPADAPLVLAEIWPRLALKEARVVKSDRESREKHLAKLEEKGIRLEPGIRGMAGGSDHAFDALAAGIAMASGRWPLLDRATLSPEAAREGWILGVEP